MSRADVEPDAEALYEALIDLAHVYRGYLLCSLQRDLPERPRGAVESLGQYIAFTRLINILEHYREHGELPSPDPESPGAAYAEISQAVRAVEEATDTDTGSDAETTDESWGIR